MTAKRSAKQVRQVTYWIIAAQIGIALSLAIPGRAVMALVGSGFTGGTATLGFLLAAEVIAAMAVVSEAALIFVARTRNMIISIIMLGIEAGLAAALILFMRKRGSAAGFQATGPAIALCVALAFASIAKSRLLLGSSARRCRAGAGISPGRPRRGPWSGAAIRYHAAAACCSWSRRPGGPHRIRRRLVDKRVHRGGPRPFPDEEGRREGLREAEDAAMARDQIEDTIV